MAKRKQLLPFSLLVVMTLAATTLYNQWAYFLLGGGGNGGSRMSGEAAFSLSGDAGNIPTTLPSWYELPISSFAVMCVIIKNEDAYLTEWIDYHVAAGFAHVYVYDNNDDALLMQQYQHEHVTIRPFRIETDNPQQQAYRDCAFRLQQLPEAQRPTYVAFLDVDEFLVMKRHHHVVPLLNEYLSPHGGSLSVHWHQFGSSNQTFYDGRPVTCRFVYRDDRASPLIKSIVKLSDMNVSVLPHAHFPKLIAGKWQWDTAGQSWHNAANHHRGHYKENVVGKAFTPNPTDVVVLHHYKYKSYGEFVRKRMRGQADKDRGTVFKNEQLDLVRNRTMPVGTVYDDAAWQQLLRTSLRYRDIPSCPARVTSSAR